MNVVKPILAIVLITTTIFLLSGCGPRITEGEIVDKEYMEETMTASFIPMVISNGKTTTTTMIPMFITYPESWQIIIKAFDKEKGDYVYEDFYVEKNVYDSVKVGDYFRFDSEMGTNERPEIQEEVTEEEVEEFNQEQQAK